MASETVDPIDRSHPPPYTGQCPQSSTFCTLHCGLHITKLAALSQPRTCDFRMPDQRTAGAATQGRKYVRFNTSFQSLRGWWRVSLWTPLCYFFAIMHSFSQSTSKSTSVWGSVADFQLLERQVRSVVRLCPDLRFLTLYRRRRVAGLCMLYEVISNSNNCSLSCHLLLPEFGVLELLLQYIL